MLSHPPPPTPDVSLVTVPTRHFYGLCAVVLGFWETAAYLGKAPTITSTVKRVRHRKAVRVGVWLWLAGLERHLLR